MSVIRGCQEGKVTPKLVIVKCPGCGEELEVFVRMGGGVGETGTTVADEVCDECGAVVPAATPIGELEQV